MIEPDPLPGTDEKFPLVLRPVYSTPSPDSPIKLYEDAVELSSEDQHETAVGTIEYEWPHAIRCTFHDLKGRYKLGEASLRFPNDGPTVNGFISRNQVSFKKGIDTQFLVVTINEPVVFQSRKKAVAVAFHVTNFAECHGDIVRDPDSRRSWRGRMSLEAHDWRITVDTPNELRGLTEPLKLRGGYALTHTGRLERLDGGEFTKPQADEMLRLIAEFLSFLRGFWVAPLLPVAFDADGNRVWEEWSPLRASSWCERDSWFTPHHCELAVAVFRGFAAKWADPDWQRVIRLANYWYVAANLQEGGLEGSLILAQSTLELLAWVLLVENLGLFKPATFDKKLTAEDKIRKLLTYCQIPVSLSSHVSSLAAFAAKRSWDGPQSLVKLRNWLVHPEKKNRTEVGVLGGDVWFDAWKLTLWYIELVMLHLFDYHGSYGNRLRHDRWVGEVERVPWCTNDPTCEH